MRAGACRRPPFSSSWRRARAWQAARPGHGHHGTAPGTAPAVTARRPHGRAVARTGPVHAAARVPPSGRGWDGGGTDQQPERDGCLLGDDAVADDLQLAGAGNAGHPGHEARGHAHHPLGERGRQPGPAAGPGSAGGGAGHPRTRSQRRIAGSYSPHATGLLLARDARRGRSGSWPRRPGPGRSGARCRAGLRGGRGRSARCRCPGSAAACPRRSARPGRAALAGEAADDHSRAGRSAVWPRRARPAG